MVRRTCDRCGRINVTRARHWWKCSQCGKRNHIKRPKPVNWPKKKKLIGMRLAP